jgi:hypothetical protein
MSSTMTILTQHASASLGGCAAVAVVPVPAVIACGSNGRCAAVQKCPFSSSITRKPLLWHHHLDDVQIGHCHSRCRPTSMSSSCRAMSCILLYAAHASLSSRSAGFFSSHSVSITLQLHRESDFIRGSRGRVGSSHLVRLPICCDHGRCEGRVATLR